MVAERKVIDLEDIAGGDALADELERHPQGVVLRRGGIRFATVVPELESDGVSDIDARKTTLGWRKSLEVMTPDSVLDAIPIVGINGIPLVRRPMTPERVERILDLVGSIEGLVDADAMHRIVEEGRQASIARQLEEIRERKDSPEATTSER